MKKCNCESTCEDCRMERENNEDMWSIYTLGAVIILVAVAVVAIIVKIVLVFGK